MSTESNSENTNDSNSSKNTEAESSVVKMRDSDIKWRAKYKMTKEELETVKLKGEQEAKVLQEKVNSVLKDKQTTEQKFIEAKLESMAVASGITDIDLVKLIDKTNIKIDETGQINGITEAVQAFRQAKPNFFGAEKKASSSSNAASITEGVSKPLHATDMTAKEWEIAKRKLMSGNLIR